MPLKNDDEQMVITNDDRSAALSLVYTSGMRSILLMHTLALLHIRNSNHVFYYLSSLSLA